MYPKSILLLFCIFIGTAAEIAAQSFLTDRMEIGAHAGASHYIGEINEQVFGAKPFSAGLSAKYYFNPMSHEDRTWGLRLDANFTQIARNDADSDDEVRQQRGLHFRNNIVEVAALAEFQFYNYRATRVTHLFTPYVFAGIGGIYHNPKAEIPDGTGRVSLFDALIEARKLEEDAGSGELTNIQKYSKFAFAIPFGAGIKLNLRGPWTVGVELNYRYVFSDFIDGIGSNKHLNFTAVENFTNKTNAEYFSDLGITQTQWEKLANPEAAKGGNYSTVIGNSRGNEGNDFFMTTVLKVSYTLYKYRDPSWK